MGISPAVYKLQGQVQHYTWGGFSFLPQLLHRPADGRPFAEYWLGAHPSLPAEIDVHGDLKKLDAFIAHQPQETLGAAVAANFGTLPFLLKVLDVRNMLSIQVHPDKASATAAFDAENKNGVPIDAPHRNYKDRNHKPELMVALSDFWLLHGFKPEAEIWNMLEEMPDFSFLKPVFEKAGYRALYERIMTLPQRDVNAILEPLAKRLEPLYENGELLKSSEDFWAARAVRTFCKDGVYDRGIFSIYFFNVLHLKKGEGIYQPAGMPHAYLEGQNVEIMAASDNVLRAGLTDKYIDINELLKHVRFEATHPKILEPSDGTETVYKSEAAEFELRRITVKDSGEAQLQPQAATIVLQITGETGVQWESERVTLQSGEALFITPGTLVTLRSTEAAELFEATVPRS